MARGGASGLAFAPSKPAEAVGGDSGAAGGGGGAWEGLGGAPITIPAGRRPPRTDLKSHTDYLDHLRLYHREAKSKDTSFTFRLSIDATTISGRRERCASSAFR